MFLTAEEALASGPWEPKLETLPTFSRECQLIDSADNPLPGEAIEVTYQLNQAMPFFNYIDGSVPELWVADAVTDNEGKFVLELPHFRDAPFFRKHGTRGHFSIWLLREGVPRHHPEWQLLLDWDRSSSTPDLQISMRKRQYPAVRITVLKHGRLSGKIGQQFWTENKIAGALTWDASTPRWIYLVAEARGRANTAALRSDKTFSMSLPPGTYDLYLHEMKSPGVLHRKVLVAENIVLQEAQEKAIEVR